MKKLLLLVALMSGCSQQPTLTPEQMDILCECFAVAAYDAIAAEQAAASKPELPPCCGRCGKNGLPRGKVLSGDGISVVECPCDPSCECKSLSASSRPICTSGTCSLRKPQK